MKIVVIGTGNVAVVVSKKLKVAGHTIVQVFGRNHIAAALLASQLGAPACASWNSISQDADLYLLALSDKALTGNIPLTLTHQLVVHTAGAVSMQVLKNLSSSYGVLYPFQTIRKEVELLPEIPFLIDANSPAAIQQLLQLGNSISSKVMLTDDRRRMQYHLCAVMTNNFSNYLYVLAEDFCNRQGLDFSALQPLINETAQRLYRFSPRQVQTGPAIRKDTGTIELHLDLLKEEPALQRLYKTISDEMLQYPW